MAADVLVNNDFKSVFKFYKQKSLTDFSSVLNVDDYTSSIFKDSIKPVVLRKSNSDLVGVKSSETWKAFCLTTVPGVILVRNPFTPLGQRYWIARCLRDYPRKPNRRNIDIDNSFKDVDQLWEHCLRYDISSFDKLRWATLGYHHNWDTKVYSEDSRTPFPEDLALLSGHVADVLGFKGFSAEAAIINMYHLGSTLSGHIDKSEENLNAPLLSFSFGQSAVFLIGGTSPNESATPILLQSGDILLMSQKARLCLHGVPRILSSNLAPWDNLCEDQQIGLMEGFDEQLISEVQNLKFWVNFEKYVSSSRINMNVRQVLADGLTSLSPTSN